MQAASKMELLHYFNIRLENVEEYAFGCNKLSVAMNTVCNKNHEEIVTRSSMLQGHITTFVSAMQFTKSKKNNL
jgi:hypothetical protein